MSRRGGWCRIGGETMKVLDPGHSYLLDALDGDAVQRLTFVKREGDKYPGNVGSHSGTTMQEVLRVLVERAKYVYRQTPCEETKQCIFMWERSILLLEQRAARRHGRELTVDFQDVIDGVDKCDACGHVGCSGDCRAIHDSTREQ